MKISCTVREFGQIVRDCHRGDCGMCALSNVCQGDRIEDFVHASDITDDPEDKERDV
jgi:hypothetical protein